MRQFKRTGEEINMINEKRKLLNENFKYRDPCTCRCREDDPY